MREKNEGYWKKKLTPEQYHVLRESGTERAGTGKHLHEIRKGVFVCAGCGATLFDSESKFESGTGWPSFFDAKKDAVEFKKDFKLIWPRTEVRCKKCGGHLGHVFRDGPAPTGKRYCMNSLALDFKAKK
jgi:peptide-methionine (R)-S-oxide reductase